MKKKREKVEVDLADAQPIHLACRDFKHAWTWRTDFVVRKDAESGKATTVTRLLVCVRCDAERRDVYSLPSLDHISSTYTYPPGYLIPGAHGHIYVATVRAELFKRMRDRRKR
jgi:hypothetical protein